MKLFFIVSALFNFLVVITFVAGNGFLFPLFGIEPSNGALSFLYLLLALVAMFGIAYYKIAFDPYRYREIILLGAQSKFVLVLTGLVLVASGLIAWPILLPLAADLVFAAIFLKHYRSLQQQ